GLRRRRGVGGGGVGVVQMTSLPHVGITVGDPAGIGPEIARKAAADPAVTSCCRITLYGPSTDDDLRRFETGKVTPAAGKAAYDAVVAAVHDARHGRTDGVATH